MDWEEELALMQRKVDIDENLIILTMQHTAERLQEAFLENHVYNDEGTISTNLKDKITIKGIKDINFKISDKEVIISSSLKNDYVHVSIKAIDYYYKISYCNSNKKDIEIYELTEERVNEAVGDVVFQVQSITQ